MADLHVINTGAIVILTPISEAGRRWVDENCAGEGIKFGECSLEIGRGYFGPIIDAAIADGLDLS